MTILRDFETSFIGDIVSKEQQTELSVFTKSFQFIPISHFQISKSTYLFVPAMFDKYILDV